MYRYLCRIFLRLFPRADCFHCLSVFWWSNSFASENYHALQICPNGQKFSFSQCFQWDVWRFFALWRRKTMKFRQWMGRLVSAKSYGPGVLEFEGGCSKAECLRSCWTRNSSCCIHLTRWWVDLESDIAWISIWSQQIAHFLVHFKGTEFRSFLRWIFPLILLIRRPVRCLRRGRCSLLLQWETKGGRNKCEKQPSWIQKNGWQILPKCFSLFPYISITVSIIWTWRCLNSHLPGEQEPFLGRIPHRRSGGPGFLPAGGPLSGTKWWKMPAVVALDFAFPRQVLASMVNAPSSPLRRRPSNSTCSRSKLVFFNFVLKYLKIFCKLSSSKAQRWALGPAIWLQFQGAECQEHGEISLDEWLRMFHAASMKKKLKDLSRCSHVSKRATYQNAKTRSINCDFANITKKRYGSI